MSGAKCGANQLTDLSADYTPDFAIPKSHCKKFPNDEHSQEWVLMQRLEEIFRSTSESTECKVYPSKYYRKDKKITVNYILNT